MGKAEELNAQDPPFDGRHLRRASIMQAEVRAIVASEQFRKAPTLKRLLMYLFEQTLAGNGAQLKSYVVGVDGLGKDPDFDPNIDSYPRVQVLRLRKLLEGYYARHAPAEGLCVYIPAGSYHVQLARRSKAYPELIEPAVAIPARLSDEPKPESGTTSTAMLAEQPYTGEETAAASVSIVAKDVTRLRIRPWWLFTFFAVFAALGGGYLWWHDDPPVAKPTALRVASDSPVLLIERPTTTADDASQEMAGEAYAKLADSIRRTWITRLLLVEPGETGNNQEKADYRLAVQLGAPQMGGRSLYMRLTDARSDALIWSGTTWIEPGQSLPDSLGRSIVQLAGPFGAIAGHEIAATPGDFAGGYRCLLRYVDDLNKPQPQSRAKLANCLGSPIGNPRLDAVRLGLLSFHTVETAPRSRRNAAIAEARLLAQRAILTDPTEAYAHFAMARIFFVSDDCAMGLLHTRHAAEANSYDPVLLAVLGNFAALCGDPEGERLLKRAFEFRSPGESYARLSLILAAIRSGRTDQLPALSAEAENIPGINIAYHHLCETLIAAASGNLPKAKAEWQRFGAASAVPAGTPDEMMQRVVLSQQVRDRIIAYLQSKGVLAVGR